MPISTENMLHGAALLTLLISLDTLDEGINYRISSGETKSCYKLSLSNENNVECMEIGLFIKRSRKRLSPWRYTFTKDNQFEIERLLIERRMETLNTRIHRICTCFTDTKTPN